MSSSAKRSVPEVMLLRYLAGDLSAAEREEIEAERRSSPELAARIAELEREQTAYFAAHPPAAMAHQLWTRLSVEDAHATAQPSARRWWRWFLLPSAATAAAVLFAVFVVRESRHAEAPTLVESAAPRSDVELAEDVAPAPATVDESEVVATPAKPAASDAAKPATRSRSVPQELDAPAVARGAEGLAFGDGVGARGGGAGAAAPGGIASKGTGLGGGGGLVGEGTQGIGRGVSGKGASVVRRGESKKERVVEREELSRDDASRSKSAAGPADAERRTYAAPPPSPVVAQETPAQPAPKAASPVPAPLAAPEAKPSSEAKNAASLAYDSGDSEGERARRAPPRPQAELVVRSGGEVRRSRGGTASAAMGDRVVVLAQVARDAYVMVATARAGGAVQTLWRGRMQAGEPREVPVVGSPRAGEGPLYVFVIASDEPLDPSSVFANATSLPAGYAGAIGAEPGSFVRLRLTARP